MTTTKDRRTNKG